MTLMLQRVAPLALALGVVLGCESKTSSMLVSGGDGSMLYSCDSDTRAPKQMDGLTETSAKGTFVATVMSIDPAMTVKGTNSWTVQIADMTGAPVDGLAMNIVPFMPDHQHGTSIAPVATGQGGGVYSITPLYLYMEGYWTVTITLQPMSGSGTTDTVIIPACVP